MSQAASGPICAPNAARPCSAPRAVFSRRLATVRRRNCPRVADLADALSASALARISSPLCAMSDAKGPRLHRGNAIGVWTSTYPDGASGNASVRKLPAIEATPLSASMGLSSLRITLASLPRRCGYIQVWTIAIGPRERLSPLRLEASGLCRNACMIMCLLART